MEMNPLTATTRRRRHDAYWPMADVFVGRSSRKLLIVGGALIAILIIAVAVLSYQSRRASFCDSCHYMAPYVRHWQASSHADIECVKCHDYGLGDLTINAIKYATDTYIPPPESECSGCQLPRRGLPRAREPGGEDRISQWHQIRPQRPHRTSHAR